MRIFYLGGDVSKGYADFVMIDQERCVVEPCFRLDDNTKGHGVLETMLRKTITKYPDAEIRFGVESTGGYENNWLHSVYTLGKSISVRSARINPCGIKKFMDADLKRTINDEVSAECIARYMIAHPDKLLFDQEDQFYSLRRQWTSLGLLKKTRTQFTNNLQSLLYTANPGVLIYCRRGIPGWLFSVLGKYPVSHELAKARASTLASIKHVGTAKAKALLKYARSDVASTADSDMAYTVKQMVQQIKSLTTAITAIENQFAQTWGDNQTVSLIASIKGIGVISAIGLMINIRDIRLFPDVKNLASYFGVHPIWKTSGDGAWGFHMSKIGRSEPRAILFMTVLSAIVHNPVIKKLYTECRGKGKSSMGAIGICMHKMLRIVYGILRTKRPFDPEIDQRNKEKGSVMSQSGLAEQRYEDKLRRFQPAELDAPISTRQAKKRKKAMGPNASESQSAGSPSPVVKICSEKIGCKSEMQAVIL